MRLIHLCGAACIASSLPSGAIADLIFDQTVAFAREALESDFEATQLADDFQLQPGASTISDVHWWGGYNNNTPGTDDFTIRIFADISGTPEIDPLNEFAVGTVNRVDTGVVGHPDLNVFFYSVEISPLALAANTTYWLSIVNDTTTTPTLDFWGWSTSLSSHGATNVVRTGDGTAWMALPQAEITSAFS